MTALTVTAAFESVTCAYCRGLGRDRWDLLSPLSSCSACAGHGTQLVRTPHRTCAHCGGDGAHPHLRMTCTTCGGAGVVHVPEDAMPCPICGGRGIEPPTELHLACLLCGGRGWWWQ
jgi:DnaJ-class molecular chaperone